MNIFDKINQIGEILKNIPKLWDGRESILEMKEVGYPHWRQMEWMGFYFQFLCGKLLSNIMNIPGPKYNFPYMPFLKNSLHHQ